MFSTQYIPFSTYGTDYILSGTYGTYYIIIGMHIQHSLSYSCSGKYFEMILLQVETRSYVLSYAEG